MRDRWPRQSSEATSSKKKFHAKRQGRERKEREDLFRTPFQRSSYALRLCVRDCSSPAAHFPGTTRVCFPSFTIGWADVPRRSFLATKRRWPIAPRQFPARCVSRCNAPRARRKPRRRSGSRRCCRSDCGEKWPRERRLSLEIVHKAAEIPAVAVAFANFIVEKLTEPRRLGPRPSPRRRNRPCGRRRSRRRCSRWRRSKVETPRRPRSCCRRTDCARGMG